MTAPPRQADPAVASPERTRRVPRLRLDLAYDGTGYAGWQLQPDRPTIQGALEEVLKRLTGAPVRLHGASRTDAGVHARGQVAHIDLPVRRDPDRLGLGCNALLPADIRVRRIRRVRSSFHARFDAVEKEYRYRIWNAPVADPCQARYRTHIRRPLDAAAMQAAARALEGRHDFAAFAANPNREIDGTVRTLRRLDIRRAGPAIEIRAVGDGFLYRMVRSLAGYLIRVGTGELPAASAPDILASRLRTARVPTAPPEGLILWRISYRARRAPPA